MRFFRIAGPAIVVLALLLPVPPPAGLAQSAAGPAPARFTAAERTEIVRIVREALKSDPSILRDAVAALQAEEELRHDTAARAAVAASRQAFAGDPVAGNPSGDVTVIEFYDVRCPYCRHMRPVLEQLLRQDHGVRLVLKDLPVLGPASVLGARALLAAQRQGGYLRLQELLLTAGPPTEDSLRAAAQSLGLDWTRMQRDMADPAIQSRIDANLALGRALGIDGTPTFVIGGKLIAGEMDLTDLQHAVRQARSE